MKVIVPGLTDLPMKWVTPRLTSALMNRFVLSLATLLMLAGCTHVPSSEQRRDDADRLAQSHGWQRDHVLAGAFDLVTYLPTQRPTGDRLAIYIEGDGYAWISAEMPSADPTPRVPVALQLALAQPSGSAAYLARPCQYLGAAAAQRCGQAYWTGRRFAPEVIKAADAAVSALKARFGARHLTLVGYSGGAAVAALVAARRDDVERLVSVDGNLDPRTWAKHHGLAPLDGSLDPADVRGALARIPQWHLAGGRDTVVPPFLTERFIAGFPRAQRPALRVIADYDHRCCWAEAWPRLWREGTQDTSE